MNSKLGFDGYNPVRPHWDFVLFKGLTNFFQQIYFRIKGSISGESAVKVYKSLVPLKKMFSLINSLVWRRNKHDFCLQIEGKPKSSTLSGEEIHYSFFDVEQRDLHY